MHGRRLVDQDYVVELAHNVLKVVVCRILPADQIAVGHDLPARLVAVGIDHGLVRLLGEPLVEPADQCWLAEDASVLQSVVRDPQAERLFARVEFGR